MFLLLLIGWLAHLANATDRHYLANGTGGPSIKSRYITSMYFTFTTLTSVGFGNVAPNTPNEKIYAIVVMMIGCKDFSNSKDVVRTSAKGAFAHINFCKRCIAPVLIQQDCKIE